MRVAFPEACAPHWADYAHALVEGVAACGDEPVRERERADCSVVWGWRHASIKKARHHPVLVMERGYIDRFNWVSLGWNGLNNKATRPPAQDWGQRYDDNFEPLVYHPWRVGPRFEGGYALLLGQVIGDASLAGIVYPQWLVSTARRMKVLGYDVRFRPHPKCQSLKCGFPVVTGTLEEALAGARFAVTYNSNSAVDAVFQGVPCVTADRGSMAWDVTSHNLLEPVIMPTRDKWAAWLAWQQWKPSELQDGSAWHVLREKMICNTENGTWPGTST
jgi:hypothetical protein